MRYFLICFKLQDLRSRTQVSGHMVYKNEFLDINAVVEKATCQDNVAASITSVFELTKEEYDFYLEGLSKKFDTSKTNYPETDIP